MLSNEEVRQEAIKLFPHTPIIAPKRIITCFNLEKLLSLPKGYKVLLVNHPRVATEDTIESLVNFGINHLEYIPYWVGKKLSLRSIDTAVSPGMTHLVPRSIKNVIDIGPRTISIHSFLRLLIALDLDLVYLEKFANSYHNLLIKSSRKLTSALDRSEILCKNMEVILNEFEDGVLSVNENNQIELVNTSVIKLLNIGKRNLMNKKIAGLIDSFEKLADLVEDSQNDNKSAGIYSYNNKKILINIIPVSSGEVKSRIYTFREIDRIQKIEENVRIKLAEKGYVTKYDCSDIWSKSKKIEVLIEKARSFSKSGMNILITGESGTGKELFAHAIHRNSPRREGPFVAVNFAGLSESLIESELFGYEEGAFTGAKRGGKRGLFEQAHGGTIFLDEIGDAPLNVQSRLLRVLQEKELMRVGGSKIVPVSVRIVAATNTNLKELIENMKFRKDLYFRINTLIMEIPPLRKRKEDLIYILNKYLKKKYKITKKMSPEAIDCIMAYDWPGNVRELINTAEYICYSSEGKTQVELIDLPDNIRVAHAESLQIHKHESKQNFDRIVRDLSENYFSLEMICQLLKILKSRKKMVSGRNTLKKEMLRYNYIYTEGNMKRFLKILRMKGLVTVGTTKQGTKITEVGEEFLYQLQLT
jgi:transcriptional regulator with PAS, ATPase and Fis domain